MFRLIAISFFIIIQTSVLGQSYTTKDSLQGGLRHERTCYDVQHYGIELTVVPKTKNIIGSNKIEFKVVENTSTIQIDLFENMQIDSIIWNTKKLVYTRKFNAVFVLFPDELQKNSLESIKFYYQGNPIIAKKAPWDGGFVFSKDSQKEDWIAVAVQGTGASLWFPCKDSQSDEPNFGASISVAVPNNLMCVSNGRFLGNEKINSEFTRWDWEVKNPINSYNITLNIGDYVHIHDNYKGLDLDYYVLRENEEKAKIHFEVVKPMMECFQSKFGDYPFKEDGYKLVETPYLGMEHQSAIAYGNGYKKGYRGSDLSMTGIGLTFDYIIIHESGHEWFGNSITSKDIADMWIHEGFTQYSEIVFVECQLGYEKAMQYANGLKMNVRNDKPIIGDFGVNSEGSGDMYPKGALMLNTLRHIINDDVKWWKLIFDYSTTFKNQIIDTETVISFFNKETRMNLTPLFDQYLRYKAIPKLEIIQDKKSLKFRWITDVSDFQMPVELIVNNSKKWIQPTTNWKTIKIKKADTIDVNNYQQFFKKDLKKVAN